MRLLIEVPDEEVDLLLALLPKLGARLISRTNTTVGKSEGTNIIEPFVKFDGQYFYDTIELDQTRYDELKGKYSNAINKNNSDVGKVAVEIVADYLIARIPNSKIRAGIKGADLELVVGDNVEPLEVKGTTASNISWPKIKVSSKDCHDGLVSGMTMVRVVNADTRLPILYFLKHGRDFRMAPEDRWSVHPIKAARLNE
ncbi:hypothetical protein [Spirosoma arcticum]